MLITLAGALTRLNEVGRSKVKDLLKTHGKLFNDCYANSNPQDEDHAAWNHIRISLISENDEWLACRRD